MLTLEQVNLVEQFAGRVHKKHIVELRSAIEWVNKLDPRKPNFLGEIYEGFLSDTHRALEKFEEELVSSVVQVVERISPDLSRLEMEQLLTSCTKYAESGLYEKRLQIFREALERNANRYGIAIDYKVTRFDLYEARYIVGNKNQLRSIMHRLKNELEVLVLANESRFNGPSLDSKENNITDAIVLKPGIFGIGLDLKKIWQWWRSKRK